MGELVAVMAASHAPNLLLELGKEWTDFMDLHYSMMPSGNAERPTDEFGRRFTADVQRTFGLLREVLAAARPDALLLVANDQFVNFFYNNIPTFCLGVGTETSGKFSRHSFRYPCDETLARQLLETLIDEVGNEEFLNCTVAAGAGGDATATVLYDPDRVAPSIGFAVWLVGAGRL